VKETDVAVSVIEYLRGSGWDVYQEIEPWSGGAIADIVAQRHGLLWIVECKTTLGLAVLGQAWDWSHMGAAHFVSVAAPWSRPRPSGSDNVLTHVLLHTGIGVLRVDPERFHGDARDVREWKEPKLNRWARKSRSYRAIRKCLTDTTRDYAEAGNANGKRWTPFQETCDRIRATVSRGPMTLRALVESIHHHYRTDATAKSALRQWLRAGAIRGVRLNESVRPAVVESVNGDRMRREGL
jgi:hypothetical protein